MSEATNTGSGSPSNSQNTTSWLTYAIGSLVALVVLVLFVLMFGSVHGEEFNPWTFRRQTYRFIQIPIVGWQVWPTKYVDKTGTVERNIAGVIGAPTDAGFSVENFDEEDTSATKLGSKSKPAKRTKPSRQSARDRTDSARDKAAKNEDKSAGSSKVIVAKRPMKITGSTRWDIVTSKRSTAAEWQGDAKILCDMLDIRDHSRDLLWDTWTTDNPKAAAVLWPIVARTAQANLYVLIPDLLRQASDDSSATRLQTKLESVLTQEAARMGNMLLRNEKPERARDAFQLVLDYDSGSVVAQQGMDVAQTAIEAKESDNAAGTPPKSEGNKVPTENQPPPAEVSTEFEE